MADWRIEILPEGDGVAFRPFFPDAERGHPLRAEPGDTVVWTNRTDQPVELVSEGDPTLNQTIGAGRGSRFQLVLGESGRLDYHCVKPEQAHYILIA